MIFRKDGRLPLNLTFYGDILLEKVHKFTYFGIVSTTGGSFSEEKDILSGQAQNRISDLNITIFTILVKFVFPKLLRRCVSSYFKVQDECADLFFTIQDFNPIP